MAAGRNHINSFELHSDQHEVCFRMESNAYNAFQRLAKEEEVIPYWNIAVAGLVGLLVLALIILIMWKVRI